FGRWRTSRRSAFPILSSGRFRLRQIRPMVAHEEMVRVRGVRAVLTDPRLPRDHPHLLKRRQVAPHRPDALRRQLRDLLLRRPAHAVFVGEVGESEEHQLRPRLLDILIERPCDRLYAHLNKPGGWNPGRPRAGRYATSPPPWPRISMATSVAGGRYSFTDHYGDGLLSVHKFEIAALRLMYPQVGHGALCGDRS